jgi:hypothetical protein
VVLLSILAATSSYSESYPPSTGAATAVPPLLPARVNRLHSASTVLRVNCPAEKDKFVELFYNRYISHLLAALVAAGDAAAAPPASSNGGVPAGPAGAGAAAGAAGAAAPAKPAATGPAPKPGAARGPGQPPPSAATVGLVVDLLCLCVVSHSYRIKYYILRNNVVEKVRRP